MKSGIRLTAFITAILLFLALSARPASAVVSPDGSYCLDGAGALTEKTKDYITERNHNLEASCSGAQICVVVVSSVGYDPITEYARKLFEKWQLGRAGEDNGVLVLMAVDDADYIVLSGSGLSSVLNAEVLTDVMRNYLEPFFSSGDYDNAAKEAFKRLNELVCRFYGADPTGYAGGGDFVGGGSGRTGSSGGRGISCGDISCNGLSCVTLAACGACVGYELLSSLGGEN